MRNHVSGTGGTLVACGTCRRGGRLIRRSVSSGIPLLHRVCGQCRGHYRRTKTVSFSSLLLRAGVLFHSRPSMLRGCEDFFRFILISRCRSAGFTRRLVMRHLYRMRQHVYIIKSSTRDVCSFQKTGVSGVLRFGGRCPNYHVFGLRQGCHSARGVMGTTGDLVRGGAGRVPGAICSRGRRNDGISVYSSCSSCRRKCTITNGVGSVEVRGCSCTSFTVLCQAGTRSHVLRRTLHGEKVPCGVCKNLSFCRHGRIGSIVSCLHLVIGPRSRRTFGHIVGCPTHKVNSAALGGLIITTASRGIDL